MKPLLTFLSILFTFSLFGQDTLFSDQQFILNTKAWDWYDMFNPVEINDDGIVDFIGEESWDLILYRSDSIGDYQRDTISDWFNNFVSLQDFDADGFKDVLIDVDTYFKNDGENDFIETDFTTDKLFSERFIHYHDIDNNGFLDIISRYNDSYYEDSFLKVRFSNEWNLFESVELDQDSARYGVVSIADINNDNKMDVVCTKEFRGNNYNYKNYLMYFINNGDFTFQSDSIEISGQMTDYTLEVEDFDLDGDPDILFLASYDKPHIIENDGGVFLDPVKLSNKEYHHLKTADIDNDGDEDIIGFDFDFSPKIVSLYYSLNEGDLSFGERTLVGEIPGFSSISYDQGAQYYHAYDVDNDNYLDLILNSPEDTSIYWYQNLLAVPEPTEIVLQPSSSVNCIGDQVVLMIEATGTNLSYQWQFDGNPIDGASEANYSIDVFASEDAGAYHCIVTGDGGEVTSEEAIVSLETESPEIFSTHPDLEKTLDENCSYILPDFRGEISATDNCDMNLQITQEPVAGSTLEAGETDIQITIMDNAGNSSQVYFSISVVDNIFPEISCSANVERTGDESDFYTVIGNEFDPTSYSDNCEVVKVFNDINGTSSLEGEKFPLGKATIQWFVEDAFENTTSCSFEIDVKDASTTKQLDENLIIIRPNPSSGLFFIDSGVIQIEKIELFNIQGIKLLHLNGEMIKQFDLSNFPAGIYNLKAYRNNKVVSKVILKI